MVVPATVRTVVLEAVTPPTVASGELVRVSKLSKDRRVTITWSRCTYGLGRVRKSNPFPKSITSQRRWPWLYPPLFPHSLSCLTVEAMLVRPS
eukprot:COSAG05_NODE_14321_length_400_cov_0.860465_1_plen_92_part_01